MGQRTSKPKPDIEPLKLAVEYRKIGDLVPYEKNARVHSDDQLTRIAKSITEFGWTNPILVDGKNGIIAGHGRLAAAQRLGLEAVPVIELAGLSDAQKQAYILADNQLALNAGWDFAILKEEVAALEEIGVDLDILGKLDLTGDLAAAAAPDQVWKTQVIKFNITFDNETQQQAWFEFVRRLQQEHPEMETLAERLVTFLAGPGGQF
jgi:hypothetical protein